MLEAGQNGVPIVKVDGVLLEGGQGLAQSHGGVRSGEVLADEAVPVFVPTVHVGVTQCIRSVERVQPKVGLPSVGHAVAEGGVQWTHGKSVPIIPVRVVQQRVGAQPDVLANRLYRTRGASGEQVLEGGVRTGGNVRPDLQTGALRQGGVTPQPIEFGRVRSRHPVRIFLGRSEPFGIGHHTVPVDIKAVVVPVKCQVRRVERVERRAKEPLTHGIKPTDPLAHVGFVTVRHPVAIGVSNPGVEVDAVVVLIQFASETTGKPGFGAVCRVGPAKLFGGVQAVHVKVDKGIRTVVLVKPFDDDFTTVNGRPIHPFLKQRFVNVGNEIAVGVGVGRRRAVRVVRMDVGDARNRWKL